jgi:hypothetical protein
MLVVKYHDKPQGQDLRADDHQQRAGDHRGC